MVDFAQLHMIESSGKDTNYWLCQRMTKEDNAVSIDLSKLPKLGFGLMRLPEKRREH